MAPTSYRDDRHRLCRCYDCYQPHTGMTCTDLAPRTKDTVLTQGRQISPLHQDDRHQLITGMTGTNITLEWQAPAIYRDKKTQSWPQLQPLMRGETDPNEYQAKESTMPVRLWQVRMRIELIVGGHCRGIEYDRRLGRKLREKTMRDGEAGLRKERNKELTSIRAPIDRTPVPKTHKQVIYLKSPITANSSPNPPFHLQTSTNSTKMSTEHTWYTSGASSSSHIAFSSTWAASPAGWSTSTGPSNHTLPDHVQNQKHFIKSFALAIAKEQKQIARPGRMGAPVFEGAAFTMFIQVYKSFSSCFRTDLAAEDVIATFPYYCSERIQQPIIIMNRCLWIDWEHFKGELKDNFHHAKSHVYMYMRSYLE